MLAVFFACFLSSFLAGFWRVAYLLFNGLGLLVGFGLSLSVGGAVCPVVMVLTGGRVCQAGAGWYFFWRALTGGRGGGRVRKCWYPLWIFMKNLVSADSGTTA